MVWVGGRGGSGVGALVGHIGSSGTLNGSVGHIGTSVPYDVLPLLEADKNGPRRRRKLLAQGSERGDAAPVSAGERCATPN